MERKAPYLVSCLLPVVAILSLSTPDVEILFKTCFISPVKPRCLLLRYRMPNL
jgi:hypothetical protein